MEDGTRLRKQHVGEVLSLEVQGTFMECKVRMWEVAGKERNSRIIHSLAGLVVGYLQMEALKGLVNSSIKEGRENLYHHSLSITHLKSSQRGAIQHMGFEVRLQVHISAT